MFKKYTFIFILILAAVLRFLWLDILPHSVNHDELYYLLNAKSFYLTGKDLTQTITPLDVLFFHSVPNELAQSELPFFLEIPTVGVEPFSLLGNALPNAFLGLLTVGVLYLITKKLFNRQTAIICGLLAAVNPWFIFISRTSYEVTPATFFFLCSFYVLLIARGWKILFSLLLFIPAFYSYIGTKLIFLPFVITSLLYSYLYVHKRKYALQYVVLFVITIGITVFYLFQIQHFPQKSRFSEILLPNSSLITQQVDTLRRTSIENSLTSLFVNKITLYGQLIAANIFQSLSPKYLFMQGDLFYSLGKHGLFYIVDCLFLLIGAFCLFLSKKKVFVLFSVFISLAILPDILHNQRGENFSPHLTLLIPFFIMVIAYGIWQLIVKYHGTLKTVVITIICTIYTFFVGNFLYIYFFQLPFQSGYFNFHDRLLFHYVNLSQSNQNIFIYANAPKELFKEYLFYDNLLTRKNAFHVASSLRNNKYSLGNVSFVSCNKTIKTLNKKDLIIFQAECDQSFKQQFLTIPLLSDSGASFSIYNDNLCSKYVLKRYVSNLTVKDFHLDNLSPQTFCATFILKQ